MSLYGEVFNAGVREQLEDIRRLKSIDLQRMLSHEQMLRIYRYNNLVDNPCCKYSLKINFARSVTNNCFEIGLKNQLANNLMAEALLRGWTDAPLSPAQPAAVGGPASAAQQQQVPQVAVPATEAALIFLLELAADCWEEIKRFFQ